MVLCTLYCSTRPWRQGGLGGYKILQMSQMDALFPPYNPWTISSLKFDMQSTDRTRDPQGWPPAAPPPLPASRLPEDLLLGQEPRVAPRQRRSLQRLPRLRQGRKAVSQGFHLLPLLHTVGLDVKYGWIRKLVGNLDHYAFFGLGHGKMAN